jgi:hypothetical protein
MCFGVLVVDKPMTLLHDGKCPPRTGIRRAGLPARSTGRAGRPDRPAGIANMSQHRISATRLPYA